MLLRNHSGTSCALRLRMTRMFAFVPADTFQKRHIGPTKAQEEDMLKALGCKTMEDLISTAVPPHIRRALPHDFPALTESDALARIEEIADGNSVVKCFLGQGYHGTKVPSVILRNVLESPAWYTAYTPYQAEIAQGRMEAMFNFQTMVAELTGMAVANASLLDEATAAAEAVLMCVRLNRGIKQPRVIVSEHLHPQTIDVIRTRATYVGLEVIVGDLAELELNGPNVAGVVMQQQQTGGRVRDVAEVKQRLEGGKAKLVVLTDPLLLTITKPPGELGADIVCGTTQRFGVPMWAGGPHAAFFATRKEFTRNMPGRLIGISKDSAGDDGFRLTLQTREQHIRLDKATSNVCTSQALLATMAGFYGCYHGPQGLKEIAQNIKLCQQQATNALRVNGFDVLYGDESFDTVTVRMTPVDTQWFVDYLLMEGVAARRLDSSRVSLSFDETHTEQDVQEVVRLMHKARAAADPIFAPEPKTMEPVEETGEMPAQFRREGLFMQQDVFHKCRSETALMRYIYQLQAKDISLVHSMITLGSCTMKLNSASSLMPSGFAKIMNIHPYQAAATTQGYQAIIDQLGQHLDHITGMDATSLQPMSGASGEYAGLCAIKEFQKAKGEGHRDVCIIPKSAHGTNPASAAMAGMRVVWIPDNGGIDLDELKKLCVEHKDNLAAAMITYPSTFGYFEEQIVEIIKCIHEHGGQVYMDGANMNAHLGLTSPGTIGADVCHLNLHKTFSIPHGGGGPGMGPICVKSHLAPYLPGHRYNGDQRQGPSQSAVAVSQAGVATVPLMFITMLGAEGLKASAEFAILNANYMMQRLAPHFKIKNVNKNGRCAHEFILDMAPIREATGITEEDFAKRLMDYGFHAPTMSWPVPRSLMIEPTESEDKAELDRFCDALIQMRAEAAKVESGEWPKDNNPLVNAPHTQKAVCSDAWDRPYSRDVAAFPLEFIRDAKVWPGVGRMDSVWGDKNLVLRWK